MSAAVHTGATWGHLKQWKSPGPTIDNFIRSLYLSTADMSDVVKRTAKKVRVLQGPIGSGKTTGLLGGCASNAQRQPKQNDGYRHYNLVVMRTDYRLLWSSFIKPFWHTWFPKDSKWTEWTGGEDQPAEHTIRLNTPFGKTIWHVQFRAISELRTKDQITNFFRGMLTTDVWLEEADAFSEDIYQNAFSRVGRFPEMHVGGPTSPSLFLGTNAPLIGSWMHKRIISGRWKRDEQYFCQPGARSGKAENLHNLTPGYYPEQIAELEEDMISRLVDNEFVMPRAGKAVHREYKDTVHGAPGPIMPEPKWPLLIGMDAGTDPAAEFIQRDGDGQWRFLNEICAPHGTGSQSFAEMLNAMLAMPRYAQWNRHRGMIRCVVDPSAAWGADKKAGELDWLQRVEKLTGITILPARTNKAKSRRDAMKAALRRNVGNARPGVIVSTECPMLRMGLGGLFHYGEINLLGGGSGTAFSVEPVKNEYSHPCEAAEYGLMEFGGLEDAEAPAGGRGKRNDPSDYPDYAEA